MEVLVKLGWVGLDLVGLGSKLSYVKLNQVRFS